MKLRMLALATPFVLGAGLGISVATTSSTPLTAVLVDTATVAPASDGTINVPGVISAVALTSAANQVRLGSVRLNGVAILDAASLDCTGAHPALLLAPTAGVVLPSVPSVGTIVNVPGVGLLTLNAELPGKGVSYVTGISASIGGHTVNLLNGTCASGVTGSTAGLTQTGGGGTGTIGVEVLVTAAPKAGAPSAAPPPAADPAASPADEAPAAMPSRTPPLPGEAPAPSPVPGSGGVTG